MKLHMFLASICGEPEPPLNGYVTLVNKTQRLLIRVRCRSGYFTTGTPPFTRTCQSDGQWSDVDIQCKGTKETVL